MYFSVDRGAGHVPQFLHLLFHIVRIPMPCISRPDTRSTDGELYAECQRRYLFELRVAAGLALALGLLVFHLGLHGEIAGVEQHRKITHLVVLLTAVGTVIGDNLQVSLTHYRSFL